MENLDYENKNIERIYLENMENKLKDTFLELIKISYYGIEI